MDPIHPIAPGPPPIVARLPVEPLQRISRERDRPSKQSQRDRRREPPPTREHEHDGEDDERPHVDVHA